jgi:hypothetical protein
MGLSRSADSVLYFMIAAASGVDGVLCMTDRNNISGTIIRLTNCALFLVHGIGAMENSPEWVAKIKTKVALLGCAALASSVGFALREGHTIPEVIVPVILAGLLLLIVWLRRKPPFKIEPTSDKG